LFQKGTKRGLGTEVPQRGPGAEPWWGPPEAEDISQACML